MDTSRTRQFVPTRDKPTPFRDGYLTVFTLTTFLLTIDENATKIFYAKLRVCVWEENKVAQSIIDWATKNNCLDLLVGKLAATLLQRGCFGQDSFARVSAFS